MSDNPIEHKAPVFSWMVPFLSTVARDHGYALGLHGSMARDLDLIAAPWIDDAAAPEVLVEALRAAVDGIVLPDGTKGGRWSKEKGEFVDAVIRNPDHKPHGRLAWNIHFSAASFVIDLSVVPRAKPPDDLIVRSESDPCATNWIVLICREGVSEVMPFKHKADAVEFFQKREGQWSDSYLCEVKVGPKV